MRTLRLLLYLVLQSLNTIFEPLIHGFQSINTPDQSIHDCLQVTLLGRKCPKSVRPSVGNLNIGIHRRTQIVKRPNL